MLPSNVRWFDSFFWLQVGLILTLVIGWSLLVVWSVT